MNSKLPIGIESLLSGAVENSRLELKASWDPKTTGWQVIRTLCAFANDLQNLNGGYVVLGIAENDSIAERPIKGLAEQQIDAAQKWIRGHCQRIQPVYMPVMDVIQIDDRRALVLWAPASDTRPHEAPKDSGGERRYWIRVGSETIAARGDLLRSLLQQTARVPFDDRRALDASVQDLRITLVREFLHDVHSDLQQEQNAERVYAAMHLTRQQNGHRAPRNVALLFFSENPQQWYRGARIEVAQFADEKGGNTIEETNFTGPIHHQIRQCLGWLENLTVRHLEKSAGQPETRGWLSYPSPALREALVNAVYHRDYEDSVEPTKIYLYPDRVEVISYPGPVSGIELSHLRPDANVPPVPARNRRIGELLKELRLAEGRGTGLPKIIRSMRDNGSPDPTFEFDRDRTYFRVTLPAHPEYVALSALRDAAYFKATGDPTAAIRRLEAAHASRPDSALIAKQLVQDYAAQGSLDRAKEIGLGFKGTAGTGESMVLLAVVAVLLDAERYREAGELLAALPDRVEPREAVEAAIAQRRLQNFQKAHRLFLDAGDHVYSDPKALHEFAQTKKQLASQIFRRQFRNPGDRPTHQTLLRDAEDFLERVTRMDAPPIRRAWAWLDLGEVRRWLSKPSSQVQAAFDHASELASDDPRLLQKLSRIRSQ